MWAKKLDLVKRLDQCVKSCSVNAAKEALNPNTNAMRRQECSGHVPYLWRKYVYAVEAGGGRWGRGGRGGLREADSVLPTA